MSDYLIQLLFTTPPFLDTDVFYFSYISDANTANQHQ